MRISSLAFAVFAFAGVVLFHPSAAMAFSGSYRGDFNGSAVRAELREQGGNVQGTVVIDGYTYRVTARGTAERAAGELQDEAGVRVPLVLNLKGSRLQLSIQAQNQSAPPLQIALVRGGKAAPASAENKSGNTNAATAAPGEIDPALVGRWSKSESYTSGDFSAASESSIHLMADGTYRFGASKVYGGGDAGSFGSEGGGGEQGRWRTANRILYVFDPASGQWSPFARYYVEGNKALLTYGNGAREVWNLRGR